MKRHKPKLVHFDEDDSKSPQSQNTRSRHGGDGFTSYDPNKLLTKKTKLLKSRKSLPIWKARSELHQIIDSNDSIIIVGATGSGKSTQIPQFLQEWGYSSKRCRIGITQPRRVAAISVAQRVAAEMGSNVGDTVGYHVRFDRTERINKTEVSFLTDGMLLRECVLDKELQKYGVIVLDEAHERTLNTDILFGLIKRIQSSRSTTDHKLKVIVMSATLQSQKFAAYFNGAAIFNVKGRTFGVETLYLSKPETNYLDATLTAVLQIHLDAPNHNEDGDILVFLTGKEEIDNMCAMLESKAKLFSTSNSQNGKHHRNGENAKNTTFLKLEVVPLYGSLGSEAQHRVFKPTVPGFRKVVVATNIAETSITIPNIGYVVDSGKVKRRTFETLTGIDVFAVEDISKEEAWQRTGRAGRTSKGFCFRLFTEHHFEHVLSEQVIPDILRSNLCAVILQLKWIGIDDILTFDLLDAPEPHRIVDAIGRLMILGALDLSTKRLTDLGEKMSVFPLDPAFSKILLSAPKYRGIERDVLMMISMLSVDGFVLMNRMDGKPNRKWMQFESRYGDHFTMLNVFRSFIANRNSKQRTRWSNDNGLNPKSMEKALRIYIQLRTLYEGNVRPLSDESADSVSDDSVSDESLGEDEGERSYKETVQCLLEGLFMSIAYFSETDKKYKTYSNNESVDIHPSSVMFRKKPRCVLYSAMVKTKGTVWLKDVTEIVDEDVIDEIMPRIKGLCTLNIQSNVDEAALKEKEKKSKSKGKRNKKSKSKKESDSNSEIQRHRKNGELKPGRAVKRMHEMFEDVNSGRFDLKRHQKKKQFRQQQYGMSMGIPMMERYMMNQSSFNMMNQRNRNFGYSVKSNHNRFGMKQKGHFGKRGSRKGRGRGQFRPRYGNGRNRRF